MITLTKNTGPADLTGVEVLRVGISWDTSTGMSGGILGRIKERMGSDLDLLAIGMSGASPVRYVGVDNLDPMRGAVVHSGDNTTGRGDGDDEIIDVTFSRIPPAIDALNFVVAAFKPGSSFARAKNVDFNIYDGTGGQFELVANAMPSLFSSNNIHQVLKASRAGSTWQMEVVEQAGNIRQGDTNSLLRFAMR